MCTKRWSATQGFYVVGDLVRLKNYGCKYYCIHNHNADAKHVITDDKGEEYLDPRYWISEYILEIIDDRRNERNERMKNKYKYPEGDT